MVGTICPVVDRTRSRNRPLMLTFMFLVGCTLGAVMLGATLGGLGYLLGRSGPSELHLGLVLLGLALSLLIDTRMLQLPLPMLRRQGPSIWWAIHDRRLVALAWGLQLGVGVLTHVHWAGFYVMLVFAVAVGLPASMMMLACYGVVRGLQPLVAMLLARQRGEQALEAFGRSVIATVPQVGTAGLVGLLVVLTMVLMHRA